MQALTVQKSRAISTMDTTKFKTNELTNQPHRMNQATAALYKYAMKESEMYRTGA